MFLLSLYYPKTFSIKEELIVINFVKNHSIIQAKCSLKQSFAVIFKQIEENSS